MRIFMISLMMLFSLISNTFADCPDPKDVVKSLQFIPLLNPGVSMKPGMKDEEFIVGLVGKGAHKKTGVNAPKTLSVFDRGTFCDYQEGTIMKGISFSIDLVPVGNFKEYWKQLKKTDAQIVYSGNYAEAQKLLAEALQRSEEAPKQLKRRPKITRGTAIEVQ